MSFLDELQKNTNQAVTENGAPTNKSSLNPCLDFFALAGAMRNRLVDAQHLFAKAFLTYPLTAIRTLFYLRDIRGGQGEREVFRACLVELKKTDEETYHKVLKFIPEYGRWDDLPISDGVELIKKQFEEDEKAMENGQPVSLMAKWLPSENASSKKSKERATKLSKLLDLKPSQYRKKVVALRKYIKLLEQNMSNGEWSDIQYDKLPSQAFRKHVKAFRRHDQERFEKFLDAAQSGEKKVNTNTLFTYEVFDTVKHDTQAANAMWANLPNYVEHDALVVADVSGSMMGRPMSVSVSLALYFAERNKGLMSGYFMTFSDNPELVRVTGNTLEQKLNMIENANWGGTTNLERTFEVILNAALNDPEKELPKVIYIISDMEFDSCVRSSAASRGGWYGDPINETVFENARNKFKAAGLTLPHVVFWNVDARNDQLPATKFDNNVTLISGCSQSTFKYAVEGKSPEESMDDIINSERYAQIVL